MALRLRVGGHPRTRNSYFINVQTDSPVTGELWQHRLYFRKDDGSWEDIFVRPILSSSIIFHLNNFPKTHITEFKKQNEKKTTEPKPDPSICFRPNEFRTSLHRYNDSINGRRQNPLGRYITSRRERRRRGSIRTRSRLDQSCQPRGRHFSHL